MSKEPTEAEVRAKALIERQLEDEKVYGKCSKICLVDANDPDKGVERIDHSPHSWSWLWKNGVWTDRLVCINCTKEKNASSQP